MVILILVTMTSTIADRASVSILKLTILHVPT